MKWQGEWKLIGDRDLPGVGEKVLLCDMNTREVIVATHALDHDSQPPETYWITELDVPGFGNQFAIFEKWTHWSPLKLPA